MLKRDKTSSEILFHHRFPTSTANVRNACHPFSTKDYFENNYVLVHNGVLHNEDKLKKEHEELGIKYVSEQENGQFNDSEALAYDVARYLEGQVEKLTASGSIAFICVKNDKKGNPVALYFGRNTGNPLKMKLTDYSITLSSEGEGDMVKANTLYKLDYSTYKLTEQYLDIPEWGSYMGYGYGYNNSGYTGNYNRPTNAYAQPSWDEDDDYDDYYDAEVTRLIDDLLYEGDADHGTAYDIGKSQYDGMTTRMIVLEDKLEKGTLQGTAEEDEYYELMTEQFYLKEALKVLRKEADRQASLPGFPLSKIPTTQGGKTYNGHEFGFHP